MNILSLVAEVFLIAKLSYDAGYAKRSREAFDERLRALRQRLEKDG